MPFVIAYIVVAKFVAMTLALIGIVLQWVMHRSLLSVSRRPR
eukprot:COSAG02_NODE_37453_length_441_cov_1.985380_1_plen_41_part_01